ncbi:uncharacterized protein LOC141635314 [Silene latifolia]|uniref:uncharacterized protein LOC141635314 n=1 Tax=Silene latifolia TaxID=37657 RepID=UPI003D77AA4C
MGMNPVCACTCTCGAQEKQQKFQEDQRAVQFLMGLNDSYATIRGTILLHNPLPKITSIYNNLLQEEGQREIHSNTTQFQPDSAALYVKNTNYKGNNWNNNSNNAQNFNKFAGYNQNVQGYTHPGGGSSQDSNVNYKKNNNYGNSNANYKGKNFIPGYNQMTNNQNTQSFQRQQQPFFCIYCNKPGHKTDNWKHLQNSNRKFAANVLGQDVVSGSYQNLIGTESLPNPNFNNGQTQNFNNGQIQNQNMQATVYGSTQHQNQNGNVTGPASATNFAGNVYSNSFNAFLNSWILDTGAIDHMCFNKASFSEFRYLDKPYSISLPNGQIVYIDTIGSVPLAPGFILQNVLYVPFFKINLLSISKISKQTGTTVSFTHDLCYLQDSSKRLLVLGKNCNDLYLLQSDLNIADMSKSCHIPEILDVAPELNSTKHSLNSVVNNVTSDIWHNRLGHLPLYKLKQLQICNVNDNKCNFTSCSICAKARQHKLSFQLSESISFAPFDLVHIDLWGPYHTQTYNGYKYFLTIVDDFSRCTWTHLLSCKSNAFVFIKTFIAMVDTQFGRKIKVIRSDNAFELGTSNILAQYLLDQGIIHQTSCFHTPQQNGVVEIKHKHLLETACKSPRISV